MAGYAFLSYCRQDHEYVRKLAAHLRAEHVPVWLDTGVEAGDSFESVIRARIAKCAVFVVVMTPAAAESAWVAGEIIQAVDAGKIIIPIVLIPCELPVPLKGRQYADVTARQLPSPAFFARLRALVGSAEPDEPPVAEPTVAVPALPRGRARLSLPTEPPFHGSWPPAVIGATQRTALEGHSGPVYAVAVAPGGRWLASAGQDGTVIVWDIGSWGAGDTTRILLRGHTTLVTALAISPDGRWLASADDDGNVRIWDPRRGRCHATLRAGRATLLALAGVDSLITVAASSVAIWSLAARRVRATLVHEPVDGRHPRVTALAVSPDGTWLVTGDDAGALRRWDLATGAARGHVHEAAKEITAITVARDGGRVAAACDDGTLRTWDVVSGEAGAMYVGPAARSVRWSPPLNPYDYRFGQAGAESVWAVAIAPDATWLATAENDRVTRVWESSTGDVRAVLRVRGRALSRKAASLALAVAPDGTWLATGDSNGTVRIWDVARGEP